MRKKNNTLSNKTTYEITAWSSIPCPYREYSYFNPIVRCKTYCGDKEKACIEKVTHRVKFKPLAVILKKWYSLWYTHVEIDVISGQEESVHG